MPICRSHDVDAPPVDLPTASEPFDVLPGSVVKSVRHRWLLKEWELGRARRALPLRAHLAREEFDLYRGEFSIFELRREAAGLRFQLMSHGTFIGQAYGSNCAGKYLDEIVPADLQAQQIEPYRQAVRHGRPVLRHALPAGPAGPVRAAAAAVQRRRGCGELRGRRLRDDQHRGEFQPCRHAHRQERAPKPAHRRNYRARTGALTGCERAARQLHPGRGKSGHARRNTSDCR